MDCSAVAARYTAAGCKAERLVDWENYRDVDILHLLGYRRTLSAVETMDFESPCTAHPVVQWHSTLACTLCSALLCCLYLRVLSRHPPYRSFVFSALLNLPQPSVMWEGSGNDFVDFGLVSDMERPWCLVENGGYI